MLSPFRKECTPSTVLPKSGHYGFIDIVAARPDFTVISPHPYDSAFVPAKQYYLDDPTAVVDVSSKGKISKISSHALPYETFSLNRGTPYLNRGTPYLFLGIVTVRV